MEIPLQSSGDGNNDTRSAFVTARETYQHQENYFKFTYQRLASAFDEINLVIAKGLLNKKTKTHTTTMKATCSAIRMRRNIYKEPLHFEANQYPFFLEYP